MYCVYHVHAWGRVQKRESDTFPRLEFWTVANHHVGAGIVVNAKSLSTIQPTYVFSYVLLQRLKRLTLNYIHVVQKQRFQIFQNEDKCVSVKINPQIWLSRWNWKSPHLLKSCFNKAENTSKHFTSIFLFLKLNIIVWRARETAQRAYCSSRGCRFSFQHPLPVAHNGL